MHEQAIIKRLFSGLLFAGGFVVFICWEKQKAHDENSLYRKKQMQSIGGADGFHSKDQNLSPILLVSHLRGGSTLTADIIQNARLDSIFYAYEPLKYAVHGSYIDQQGMHFYNNSRIRIFPPYKEVLDNIVRFYHCQLDQLPSMFFVKHKSQSLGMIKQCEMEKSREHCMAEAMVKCRKSSRFIKTIRLSMSSVEYLMEKLPKLKVVHLLRDPRGSIRSLKLGHLMKNLSDVQTFAEKICKRLELDTDFSLRLKQRYPGHLKAYLYEQFAEKPTLASNHLLHFLGITPDQHFKYWLHNHTSSGQKSSYFGTFRPDSALSAIFWRKTSYMTLQTMKTIDNVCKQAYKNLGLHAVENEADVRNLDISIRYDVPLLENI